MKAWSYAYSQILGILDSVMSVIINFHIKAKMQLNFLAKGYTYSYIYIYIVSLNVVTFFYSTI